MLIKVNHRRKKHYTSINIIGLCMVMAGIMYFASYTLEIYEKRKTFDVFQTDGLDKYFNFQSRIFSKNITLAVYIAHFIFTILFLLNCFIFGEGYQKFYYTFVVGKDYFLYFTCFSLPLIMTSSQIVTYLLFNPLSPHINVFITFKLSLKNVLATTNFPQRMTPILFFCFINNLMMMFYVLFVIHSYKLAKFIPIKSQYKDNIFTFVYNNIKLLCRKKFSRTLQKERLRGGVEYASVDIDTSCHNLAQNKIKATHRGENFITEYLNNYDEKYRQLVKLHEFLAKCEYEDICSVTSHSCNYNKSANFNNIIQKLNILEEELTKFGTMYNKLDI